MSDRYELVQDGDEYLIENIKDVETGEMIFNIPMGDYLQNLMMKGFALTLSKLDEIEKRLNDNKSN